MQVQGQYSDKKNKMQIRNLSEKDYKIINFLLKLDLKVDLSRVKIVKLNKITDK